MTGHCLHVCNCRITGLTAVHVWQQAGPGEGSALVQAHASVGREREAGHNDIAALPVANARALPAAVIPTTSGA